MKYETKTRMMIVNSDNPIEFAEKFNQMMEAVSYYTHKEPVIDLSKLTAYVLYTEQTLVVESREEKHEANGEIFYCSDCKHFHENKLPTGNSDCPFRHGVCCGWDRVCKEFWDAYEAKEDILYVPKNKDGSVNKQTNKGKRYLKLKRAGVVN